MEEALRIFDKKLEAAEKNFQQVTLKIGHEENCMRWCEQQFSRFQIAYLEKATPLILEMSKYVCTLLAAARERNKALSSYGRHLLERVEVIIKKLEYGINKHCQFHINTFQNKMQTLHVINVYRLDHSVRLAEVKSIRTRTDPELSQEEIENLVIPDFLWELNNLPPPYSQDVKDEYNTQHFSLKMEQLKLQFRVCVKDIRRAQIEGHWH